MCGIKKDVKETVRISPDEITSLNSNQIFVFGSNLRGVHGKGAAKVAHQKFGAVYGEGFGHYGNSYAIPTKDYTIKTLPLETIERYVGFFIEYAKSNKQYDFLVTKIGCGWAGYKPDNIAPLFKECVDIDNIYLPQEFIDVINVITTQE